MPLSPADQARPIRSKDELVALAHALEVEAAARYRELAERMRLSDEETLARLFLFLASVEEKHVAHIDRRSLALLGHLPAAAQVRWELPETFDEEAARSARLTPYDALAVAVRNEERAFAFYAYVAAGTDDPAVQDFAEELAKDELEHAVLLRRERRRAFRAGPRPDAREGRTQVPGSPEELQALSSRWSAEDARAHAALADALEADGNAPLAAAFRQIAAEEGAALAGPPQGAGAMEVRDGLRLLERAFDRYADIAEHARDEAVVSEAQRLAERVLRHLALAGGTSRNALIGAAERPAG